MSGTRRVRRLGRCVGACLFACAGTLPGHALADPNDYVLTLDITAGEREFDAKLGAATHTPAGSPAAQAAALAWGAGITDYWMTELYAQFANPVAGSGGGGFDAVSWENVLRFNEPGRWPLDLGATLELERPRFASEGWKYTLGPLLQADIDDIQVNANLLFTRTLGGAEAGPLLLGYQFQIKYRAAARFEYGLQGLGDMGPWKSFAHATAASQRLGPAIFGRYKLGPGRSLGYNAALLLGTTAHAPERTLRAQLDFEY